MRPVKRQQGALEHPLNGILGTEGNVRLLRTLLLSGIPTGVSELAERAGLQRSGVARMCERLEDLGVIEAVGRGPRSRQYRMAPRFPLASELANLFHKERAHATAVFAALEQVVRSHLGTIRAAWIEGPVALGTELPADAITVGVLTEPQNVTDVRLRLAEQLVDLQSQFAVITDLRVETMADLRTADGTRRATLADVRLLMGPPPLDLVAAQEASPNSAAPREPRTHAHFDEQARALARDVADRIRNDRSLIDEARRYIERRLPSASPGERLELREWAQILETMSPPRLARFLGGTDERATRLRQSMPFVHVLRGRAG